MNTHTRTLDIEETIIRNYTVSVEVPDGKDERFDHLVDTLKEQEQFFASADELRDSIQRFYGTPVTLEQHEGEEPVDIRFDYYL